MNVSGKLVILSILSVALLAAGMSWWFRFHATHRAAEFWGPEATLLIRDATVVELIERPQAEAKADNDPPSEAGQGGARPILIERRNISDARGLIHFRNALLEDRSYDWPSRVAVPDAPQKWGVRFVHDTIPPLTVWFSPDWKLATREERSGRPAAVIFSEPISHGLTEYFNELRQGVPVTR